MSNSKKFKDKVKLKTESDSRVLILDINQEVTSSDITLDELDTLSGVSSSIQDQIDSKYDASNPNGYETPTQLNARDTANRSRVNHTGTQLASTISNFASTVLATILTGISFATGTAITATDTILTALGKLQKQITDEISTRSSADTTLQNNIDLKYNASNPNGYETPAQLDNRDTANRSRTNHTGTQAISTVTSLQASLDAKYDASNPNGYETPAQLDNRDTANRSRTNHAGTQTASTISNFATTVRSTILTGISFATSTAITAADTLLIALGKLQAQISTNATAISTKYDASNPNGYETPTQLNARDTANRSRANHTGTQLAATISDFSSATLAVLLSGISFATGTAVVSTDSILIAVGKLQAQITANIAAIALKADKSTTVSAGTGLSGGGDLSANRTISMPNVGTANTYGAADKYNAITTDAQGRVTGIVPTLISIIASQVSDFASAVRSTVLTGLSTATNSAVVATDTILAAMGKLQAQVTNILTLRALVFSALSETSSTNTSTTTFTTHSTITTTSLPTGDYRLFVNFDITASNNARSVEVRVLVDGSPIFSNILFAGASGEEISRTRFFKLSGVSGVKTIDVQWRVGPNGNTTATMVRSYQLLTREGN